MDLECYYQIKVRPADSEYQDGNRKWQGIPGVAKAPGGRLWACWYSGGSTEGPGNWIVLYTSDDDGDNWKGPMLVIDSQSDLRAFDANLWMDPYGWMWIFWHTDVPFGNSPCSVCAMHTEHPDEENPAWSKPVRIANGVAINDPVVLKDGTWVLPTTVWAIHKNDLLGEENNAGCYLSTDKGATWNYRGSIKSLTGKRDHEENMIAEKPDGSLWMLMRSGAGIEESFSTDGGFTWTHGKDANLTKTVSRFSLKRLSSGNLLLIYSSPPKNDKSRTYLTAALSVDEGKTWPYRLLLDRRFEVSYPDAQQDSDGNIYIIYDCNRWSSMEILLAKITEDDIMKGKLVTATSFLKKLVNNNGGLENQQPDFEYSQGAQVSIRRLAKIEPQKGKIEIIRAGGRLFCDDEYEFSETMPEALKGKNYLLAGTDNTGNTIKALSDGFIYLLTFVDYDPQIGFLRDQGFRTQVTLPRRQLCNAYEPPLAFMEKKVVAGEKIHLCNWSIVICG